VGIQWRVQVGSATMCEANFDEKGVCSAVGPFADSMVRSNGGLVAIAWCSSGTSRATARRRVLP
jgi:hypothetical protein